MLWPPHILVLYFCTSRSSAHYVLQSKCCGVQDFGDSIPGHGGITDRMDCQVQIPLVLAPKGISLYMPISCALSALAFIQSQIIYPSMLWLPLWDLKLICNVIQMVMAVFSYIYYQSFIAPHHYSVESFLDQVSTLLNLSSQVLWFYCLCFYWLHVGHNNQF